MSSLTVNYEIVEIIEGFYNMEGFKGNFRWFKNLTAFDLCGGFLFT